MKTADVKQLTSKVVQIEGVQWTGGAEAATPIINWILENGGTARYHSERTHDTSWDEIAKVEKSFERKTPVPERIAVDTLDSTGYIYAGDWVFRGTEGEFYPCKDDVKQRKYIERTTPVAGLSEPVKDLVNLGLATTRQLLAEISARIEIDFYRGGGGLDYSTVSDRRQSPRDEADGKFKKTFDQILKGD